MRANGDGTVWRATGKRRRPWAAALIVGWTPEGKAIKRTRFAFSEREAKVLLAEMRARHVTGRPLPNDRLTVGKWLVGWLAHVRGTVRPNTADAYEQTIRNYLLPELGTVPLRTLQPSRVEALTADLLARGYSPNTAARARDVLRRAIADAVKDGHVDRNAAALARPPRVPRDQIAAPTTADVTALLAALDGHRLRDMVLVMAATGLRVSEAMGLRWEDVADGALTVRYQLARIDGEPVLAEPKSARSRRTILLPPVAAAALRGQRARQAQERIAAGPRWADATGLVFTTADGSPLSESTLQYVMGRACREAGIRHLSPHDLRRWTATAIVATGDVKAAATVLGHVSAALTVDTYSSATDEALRRAADAVEGALG
jgi:integrase